MGLIFEFDIICRKQTGEWRIKRSSWVVILFPLYTKTPKKTKPKNFRKMFEKYDVFDDCCYFV